MHYNKHDWHKASTSWLRISAVPCKEISSMFWWYRSIIKFTWGRILSVFVLLAVLHISGVVERAGIPHSVDEEAPSHHLLSAIVRMGRDSGWVFGVILIWTRQSLTASAHLENSFLLASHANFWPVLSSALMVGSLMTSWRRLRLRFLLQCVTVCRL